MFTFRASNAIDYRAGRALPGRPATVVDAETGEPVDTYSLAGQQTPLVSNSRGWLAPFRADARTVEIRIEGGDPIPLVAVEVEAQAADLEQVINRGRLSEEELKGTIGTEVDRVAAPIVENRLAQDGTIRDAALQAMGSEANRVEALTQTFARPAGKTIVGPAAPLPFFNVDDFGAVADWTASGGGTDNYAAIQAAIDACPPGGTVTIDGKGGDYYCSQTLVVDKPIRITGGTTTSYTNRLVFPVDVTGIHIKANTGGRRPSDWLLEDLYLRAIQTDRQATGETGYGVYVTDGRGRMNNVMVEYFSNHGIYLRAGRQVGGGNVTKSVLDRVRVYGCWGDGINFYGTDVQACLVIKPDIVANAGWGLNFDTANINQVIFPHFDQRYNGSPGIIRDCANSNDYGLIYCEPGDETQPNSGHILLDKTAERESLAAKFESAHYASNLTITDLTTAKSATWYNRSTRSLRRDLSITSIDGQHQFRTDVGVSSASAVTLTYVPGPGSSNSQKQVMSYSRGVDRMSFSTRIRFNDFIQLASFTTANRPATNIAGAGGVIFDTDLGKPIVSTGSQWVDFLGNPV